MNLSLALFRDLQERPWWRSLRSLERALERRERQETFESYQRLVGDLVRARMPSLHHAVADALLDGEPALTGEGRLPDGLREAATFDLEILTELLEVDWQERAEDLLHRSLPPLEELAPLGPRLDEVDGWAVLLTQGRPHRVLDSLLSLYRLRGSGPAARHAALSWSGAGLQPVLRPWDGEEEELFGLERQLERLHGNVERFLSGRPALHTLLYGPRGSGKSTAVRSLLPRYGGRGLRLVQVAPEALPSLPALAEEVAASPNRFVAFVDDLAFDPGDSSYRPLRTLLEGGLARAPGNLLLVATSNRRHLLPERFSDRPGLDDDDVHRWDTVNERLALADRFGLLITFPSADQRTYLDVVRELARKRGIELDDEELTGGAIRFADWGNGYSGRTARQYVDTL